MRFEFTDLGWLQVRAGELRRGGLARCWTLDLHVSSLHVRGFTLAALHQLRERHINIQVSALATSVVDDPDPFVHDVSLMLPIPKHIHSSDKQTKYA
jgi:hypothetical protein